MKKILFCGDDNLNGAAAYLGGVLAHLNFDFDYTPSEQNLTEAVLEQDYGLIILSDYSASNISQTGFDKLAEKIKSGTSMLMIGGWESFYGLKGEYHNTVVNDILPVTCMQEDDRVNYCHGLYLAKNTEHPVCRNLPWDNPPVVCGYNQITPKPDTETVITLKKIVHENGAIGTGDDVPLLVLGTYGQGKTAAFTTDFAPHWTGGLVDWGDKRVNTWAEGGGEVQVGHHYIMLIKNLMSWLAG